MMPEAKARQTIDALRVAAGWHACNGADANNHAGQDAVKGVALGEFPLNANLGFTGCLLLLSVNGKACGVIEIQKEGATPSGLEVPYGRDAQGPPPCAQSWRRLAEVERRLSIVRAAGGEVGASLKRPERAPAPRQGWLAQAFTPWGQR